MSQGGKGREGGHCWISSLTERQVHQQQGEAGVQGQGKRHLATAALNYPCGTAECTGACVYASVCGWRLEGNGTTGASRGATGQRG